MTKINNSQVPHETYVDLDNSQVHLNNHVNRIFYVLTRVHMPNCNKIYEENNKNNYESTEEVN